jgi:AhpD family alkylhydroperoxidase
MIKDWNGYGQQITDALKELGKAAPNAMRGYREFNRSAFDTVHLDAKTRELIALAVAVSLRCDGCINAHAGMAASAGATREEVGEALGVSLAVNAGAAVVYSAHVMDALDAQSGTIAPAKVVD